MSNKEMLKDVIRHLLKEDVNTRNTLLKEDKNELRSFLRYCIYESQLREKANKEKISLLRESIRKLIVEAEAIGGSPGSPTELTSINFLKNLLKNIIPSIEEDYKQLTSSRRQRVSYRTHILNAVENLLNTLDADPDVIDKEMKEIKVKVGSDEAGQQDKPEGFIDIYGDEGSQEGDNEKDVSDEEVYSQGLEGRDLDKTGRNASYETFNRVKKQIQNEYSKLDPDSIVQGSGQTEREIFRDYLLLNMKLYFDKFEEDITPNPLEPETPSEDKYIKAGAAKEQPVPEV